MPLIPGESVPVISVYVYRLQQTAPRAWFANRVIDVNNNERLYAIQWSKDDGSFRQETEFRSITPGDLEREAKVMAYVQGLPLLYFFYEQEICRRFD